MAIDPKKALGRPTLYKVEYCERLIEHMKAGLSFESFAAIAGVGIRTLFDWKEAYPDFKDAHEKGLPHGLLAWEREGQMLVKMGGGPGSAAVYIFTMRNRFGWRNEPAPEKEPKDEGSKLDARNLTDQELQAQIRAKLGKLDPSEGP